MLKIEKHFRKKITFYCKFLNYFDLILRKNIVFPYEQPEMNDIEYIMTNSFKNGQV